MGEVFAGRYELVDPLGHGGMGVVWRTYDHRDGTFCAAKVLRQSDAATVLRFIREQSLRIRHPHVVAPQSWAGEDDRVLFTMDLVCGGSSSTLLHDHGPLPSAYVAVLLEQLLAALDAVHETGVVHRDVKPSNLLLEPTGVGRPFSRLTDFGIAVPMDEPRLTSTGTVLGTPGYMAPEAFRGADPEPRQDVYSAGLTAAELLTGGAPAELAGNQAALPESVPGVDPNLWELLLRMCASDPEQRPDGASEGREELVRLPDARQPNVTLLPPPGVTAEWNAPDTVEVFDHVGPLPPEWVPRGRDEQPTYARPTPGPERDGPHAPRRSAGPGGPVAAPGMGSGMGPGAGPGSSPGVSSVGSTELLGRGGTVPQAAGAGDVSGMRPDAHQQGPYGQQFGPQRGPRFGQAFARPPEEVQAPGRRPRWGAIALAAVTVGAVVGLGSSQLPWPENAATAQSGDGPGAESARSSNGLAPGDACSFVEVGERTRGAGEEPLVCVKTERGDYRWSAKGARDGENAGG